jgi:tripartite-type tricarboxylate transporter receptor subunit TctC
VNIAKKHPELEFNIMYGLFAPKGTDEKTIKAINEIVNKGLKEKKYQDSFTQAGISDFGGSAEKLDTLYKKLQSVFKRVAKNSD